jgi:hypothetical protein
VQKQKNLIFVNKIWPMLVADFHFFQKISNQKARTNRFSHLALKNFGPYDGREATGKADGTSACRDDASVPCVLHHAP